jgi:hypothetical protein
MVQYARASDRDHASARHGRGRAPFRLAVGFAVAALVLLGVFDAAEWYAEQVSISRYCGNPDATLELVRETLSERRPASDAGTRPYVVAAKLIYLIPRRDREPIGDYLARLRQRIAESCR